MPDAAIPLLTLEDVHSLCEAPRATGHVAKSWVRLTRVVQQRLRPRSAGRQRPATCVYGNGNHYLELTLSARRELGVEFGASSPTGRRAIIGLLRAHWDEIGLTGPYVVTLRNKQCDLSAFLDVLEPYLNLHAQ